MKASFYTSLAVLALLGSAAAFPLEDLLRRGGGSGVCWSGGHEGHCGKPKNCKGISTPAYDCSSHGYECCVELVCKVPSGTGYCSSVEDGGCPNGQFAYSDGSPGWPCSGGDIQCCIPNDGDYSPGNNNNTDTDSPPSPPTSGSHIGGKMPKNAIEMLKELEGFRGYIYQDQVGVNTIGYGHNCVTAPGTCELLHQPISEREAEELMLKDLVQFEKCICGLPNASKLNANQFGALVSFAFNTGCDGATGSFKSKMGASDFKGICDSMPTTSTLGGILVNRRQTEANLCHKPISTLSGC